MESIEVTDYIQAINFQKFYSLLKVYNGRMHCTPFAMLDKVYVRYSFSDGNDYKKFCEEYKRLTTNIVEKKRSKFRNFLAKIGFK